MTNAKIGLLAGAACGLLLTSSATLSSAEGATSLVLDHVTVVDTRTGRSSPDRDVVIVGDRIVAIQKAGRPPPPGARVIEARGKFVTPGFNDMHAHPLNDLGVELDENDALMLANGVTGYRQMSATPSLLQARRDGRFAESTTAPALLFMPGEIFTRQNAPTPQAAVAEVDRQKAQGADFIKVVDVTPPVFFAIAAEAKRVGLTFVGHLPNGVDPIEASNAGYHAIEHLGPTLNMVLACSTDEAAIKAALATRVNPAAPAPPPGASPDMLAKIFARLASAPFLLAARDPSTFVLMQRIADTYDEAKCRRMAQVFIRNDTWQSPTLIRDRTILFADDPKYVNDPRLRYVDVARRALWAELAQRFTIAVPATNRPAIEAFWRTQLKMLHVFDQAGVSMIAGTDLGGQWDIAGFALHDDFDLLAQDGISPLKVLQMTTLDAARFLGREATLGSVEVGKNADLVLLDADPTRSVQNLHRLHAVVRAGRYYSADELEAMKAKVAERATRPAAGAATSGAVR